MEWASGKLTQATIHSTLGGNCRLRTNTKVEVQNVAAVVANGNNANPLFRFIDPGKPIIVDQENLGEKIDYQGFVVDFATKRGGVYGVR
jgi:alpha-L-fucosidase 2